MYKPNQEIVLEFKNKNFKVKNIELTINEIKNKLLTAGATNIIVKEKKDDIIKIAYFSTSTIENIKEILYNNSIVFFKKSDKKTDKNNLVGYQFDIYELNNYNDFSNSTNKSILSTKYRFNRFSTDSSNAFLFLTDIESLNLLFKIKNNILNKHLLTKDLSSYLKPKVRAGPKNKNC